MLFFSLCFTFNASDNAEFHGNDFPNEAKQTLGVAQLQICHVEQGKYSQILCKSMPCMVDIRGR
jgi:hypothetical protein